MAGGRGADANSAAENLEKNWLSWTGAGQVYKCSPRPWALRRLSLLRNVHARLPQQRRPSTLPQSTTPTSAVGAPFAYILCCEFDAILHPSNALAALDMCERLRARNCGLVALYQVRHSFTTNALQSPTMPLSTPQSCTLSPRWGSPRVDRRRQCLGRMGCSQDGAAGYRPSPMASTGRMPQHHGGGRGGDGGISLLRMIRAREQHSLGWAEQTQQQQHWQGEPNVGTNL